MTAATLQPPSSPALMLAVSEVGAERRAAFPVDLVGATWDPWACPAELLDWLASAMSVDIWDPSWGALRKRRAIALSPALHQAKGTLHGIAAHLDQVGAQLRQAVTPTARMFATPIIDKATRDAWLARMPQLRIYLANRQGTAGPDAFAGQAFAGRMFARFDAAETIYGRFATLVDGDQETPLQRGRVETSSVESEALQLDRLFIPGGKAPALYAGRSFAGAAYLTAPVQPPRIITVALRRSYSHQQSRVHLDAVGDGLTPREVGYERVSSAGQAGRGLFAGQAPARRFAAPDRAAWLLYDRVLLQDGKRDAPWVRAHSFAGHVRLAPPAFTATLLVNAPGRLTPRAAVARHLVAGRHFAVPHDVEPLRKALAAVRASKAHRDRVLVDTATTRPRTFGDLIPLDGSFRFGGYVTRTL